MSKLKQKQLKTVNKKRQTSAFKSLNRSQKNGLKNNDSLMVSMGIFNVLNRLKHLLNNLLLLALTDLTEAK